MRAPLLLLFLLFVVTVPARGQVGAFETDCKMVGGHEGGYQFVATCAGRASSPNGRLAVVQRAYSDEQPPIQVQDALGRTIAVLPSLSDDMPFSVFWSPDSQWFFVNHHVGSFMGTLQVFEIVGRSVIERPALGDAAVRVATARYPCLRPEKVLPNGARWSRDGRHIVLVTISRPDACSEFGRESGDWKPLWMIGDVRTGQIDPASIRPETRDDGLRIPNDGLYARL